MGRKQTGAGKHVYFCIANLIFVSLLGCAALTEVTEREGARESLLRAQKLLAQEDYEGSLKENQKVVSLSGDKPPGDQAIFNMGLMYTHNGNPKKDYRRALDFFRKLMEDYPQSPLIEQAKIWVGVLEAHEKLGQENEKLSQENEKLSQANEKLSQANEKLNEVIKKSKQVDIEIEEKKREKTR
ncbi:MAG: hypothetical protein ACREQA_00100 [Candidatus Binatia bacterium]